MKTKSTYTLLTLLVCFITNTFAQPLEGDLNRTPNTAYYFSNYNFGTVNPPTITVTPPTSCSGTGSITVNWNNNISGTVVRAVNMHGGINYSDNLISATGGGNLQSSNNYSTTFSNLEPGIYTFGLYRDPSDDNLTTNNSSGGIKDDYTIANYNTTTGDQQRCAVFGVILLPVNTNNLSTLTANASAASDCITGNGTITLSGLKTNSTYNVAILVNGSYSSYVSSSTGVITISGLLPGIYPVRVRISGQNCFRQINTEVKTSTSAPCYVETVSNATGSNMIVNGDFGTSSGLLPNNSVTDYTNTTATLNRPMDSEYKLDNSTDYLDNGYNITTEHNGRLRNMQYATQNRHIFACLQNSKDHTGSNNSSNGTTNGYMMLVNANYATDRVIEISNLSLTAGKSYKLNFWAKNLQPFMPKNKNNATSLNSPTYQPIVPRIAVTLNGRIYEFADLGVTVEPSTYGTNTILDQMGWESFSVTFTSPITSSTNSVGIYNFQQGGFGNDFLIDDISMYEMIQFSGKVFDDANGNTNSLVDGIGINNPSSTLIYAYLVNSSGLVVDKKSVNNDGTYSLTGASGTNYTIRISTSNVEVGSTAPGSSSLPTNWVHTGETFGNNNNSGSGNESGTPNGVIAVRSTGNSITNVNFGINKRPESDSYTFNISSPTINTIKSLTANNGMDSLSGSDLEDGLLGQGKSFKITDVAGLNGNTLFYDANNNGVVDQGETLTANSTIINYQAGKLKVKFTGLNSTSFNFKYTTTDVAGFEDLTPGSYTVNWITPVPVKLLYFTAEKSGKVALLNWSTASEINNSHFEVLRSTDTKTWVKIGEVKGYGNSQEVITYHFEDLNPMSNNYYRLKQVDFDGKFEYTEIRQIDFELSAISVLAYPNPTAGELTLNINKMNRSNGITITITDLTGKEVYNQDLGANQSEIYTGKISLTSIPSGIYTLTVISGEEMHQSKVIKY